VKLLGLTILVGDAVAMVAPARDPVPQPM
jgi:hypothetical protein